MEYNEEVGTITTIEALKSWLDSGVKIVFKCKSGYTFTSDNIILYNEELYTDAPECNVYELESISYYEAMYEFENIKVDIKESE